MARQQVVMIKCDRCGREELKPAVGEKSEPDFTSKFLGEELSYFDLCARCLETVRANLGRVKEWERELNSLLGPKIQANEAPPVTAAPDFSPPKPHAGMKK